MCTVLLLIQTFWEGSMKTWDDLDGEDEVERQEFQQTKHFIYSVEFVVHVFGDYIARARLIQDGEIGHVVVRLRCNNLTANQSTQIPLRKMSPRFECRGVSLQEQ